MTKIVPLNDKAETIRVVLDRMLERADHLDHIVMVAHWKPEAGGGWFVDWSHMTMGTFVYAKEVLAFKITRSLESIYDPDASNAVEDNAPSGPTGEPAGSDEPTDEDGNGNVSRLLDRKREPEYATGQVTGAGTNHDTPDQ